MVDMHHLRLIYLEKFVLKHFQEKVPRYVLLGMCMHGAINVAAVFVIRSSFRGLLE
jgi:hypothetical protein